MTIPTGDTPTRRDREIDGREANLAASNSADAKTNKLNPIIEDVVKKLDDGLNWTNIGA